MTKNCGARLCIPGLARHFYTSFCRPESYFITHGLTAVLLRKVPIYLRTVPTFVSAHTFCASRKPWFRRAKVDFDAINYATKYRSFSRDVIAFLNLKLKRHKSFYPQQA